MAGSSDQGQAAGVELVERSPIACVNLRGQASDAKFMRAVTSVTDVPPPVEACTSVTGLFGSILWLGPNEWLVISESQRGEEITARLRQALHGLSSAATDVTDARIVFALAGPDARHVLAKGCSIDFHPRAFPSGYCVQTLLAKADVLIHAAKAHTFDIYVGRSFAGYARAWIDNARMEYAIQASGRE